jgi:pimeloyl-ACP methyl ester carboxylesterase
MHHFSEKHSIMILQRIISSFLFIGLITLSNSGPRHAFAGESHETVVLLHGLGRTAGSMVYMAEQLAAAGYHVVNIPYPSRKQSIETLVENLQNSLADCCLHSASRLHFVTHSLGGILVRAYLSNNRPDNLGRVVMLSPPNKGSDVVDFFGRSRLFKVFFGPAAAELGTDPQSIPNRLGAADFEVGIITGDRTIDPISSWIIDGDDDGKISIEQAKLEGMAAFRVVHVSHAFIMKDPEVASEVIRFLKSGSFAETHLLKNDK